MEFTIKLPAEHVNVILAGMDELPHKAARRTIDLVLQQVQAQQQAAQQPEPQPVPEAGLTD